MANTFRHIFLKAVDAFCWFIGTVFSTLVLVLALTIFASSHTPPDGSSPTASPTPTSYHGTCDVNKLHDNISIYMRYVVCAIVIAMSLMVFVRKVADGAAKDHERVAAWEDAAYKAALDAAVVANDAVLAAKRTVDRLNDEDRGNLAAGVVEGARPVHGEEGSPLPPTSAQAQNTLDDLFQKWRLAVDRVERLQPNEGIARLGKWWRYAVRLVFFAAVCAHYTGSVYAGYAYYYSLKIETKCVIDSLTIFIFVLVGVVLTTIHSLVLWVSLTQN